MGMMVLLLNPSEIDYVSFYEQYQFADPDPVAVVFQFESDGPGLPSDIVCVNVICSHHTFKKRKDWG